MGGTEPVCRAHRGWNDAGSPRSIGDAGLHGAVAIVRLWLWLPSPPLTAGSLPATIFFEMVALADCNRSKFA
jgi:hypothetical protein